MARNLAGHKFVNSATEKELLEICDVCQKALSEVRRFKDGEFFVIDKITEFNRSLLVGNRLASKELMEGGAGKGVYVTKDMTASAMINEEDHLRMQVLANGMALSSVWRSINALDNAVEERLEFDFSSNYGYLTACPTNVGTGMRASLMMHLPALVFSEQMDKVIRGVNQLGMVVRGSNGEGSESYGAIFQLSNQQTLGISEEEIVKKISKFGKKLVEFEINARKKLMNENPLLILDKVARAEAILKSCKLIDTAEAITCISNLRLAADMGLIKGNIFFIDTLDSLMRNIQPSHIQAVMKRYDATPDERDQMRAQYLNKNIDDLMRTVSK